MGLENLSVLQLNKKLRDGEVNQEEILTYFKERINKLDPQIKAFLDTKEAVPAKIDYNSSDIAGVPFAIKDNMTLVGHEITAGSRILKGYIAPYTATAVQRLLDKDAVVLGRTNCDEFAMGSSTENSAYGPSRNPWDLDRVPGGSSGGSAAAVAAGLIPYALGSDTGGSIRQPASFCGIVGVKPTYGRVSRHGLLALASSLDVIGPFVRTVADAAAVTEVIAGEDKMDATTENRDVPRYRDFLDKGVKGLRIGVPKEYWGEGMTAGAEKAIREAISILENLGADITEVSLPMSKYSLAAYYIILPVEVSANLSRYDGVKYGHRAKEAKDLGEIYTRSRGEGFGPEVKRRIMLGTYTSSSGYYDAYYKQALRARAAIRNDFKKVFETVDCLVSPVSPTPAFKLGEKVDDPLSMYLQDIFSVSANVAGVPAMSVPAGFDANLPVGLQIIAPWFKEEVMFQVGSAYEQSTEWHKKKPKIW